MVPKKRTMIYLADAKLGGDKILDMLPIEPFLVIMGNLFGWSSNECLAIYRVRLIATVKGTSMGI